MRHAEAITERIVHLGGEPTTHPDPITIGNTSKEILEINKKAEQEAIDLYKQIIELAEVQNDADTKILFQRILVAEENHLKTFSKMLDEF